MALLARVCKWMLVCSVCLLVVLLIAGSIYQAVMESRDLAKYPAPGMMVDVDGNRMHIDCRGEGSPTAILELGVGSAAASWDEIHQRLADITRVCAYDRAGLGYSEPFDYSRRATDVAKRLHGLLRRAGIDDELVLIGWSAGGVYIRAYHQQFPERVRAMLFVDSAHEQQANRIPQALNGNSNSALRIAQYLAPFGLVRRLGILDRRVDSSSAAEELKPRLKAIYNQSHTISTVVKESDAFDLDIDASQPPTPVGDLPLIVLTAGRSDEGAMMSSSESASQIQQRQEREARSELQRELTQLSTRGRQIVATESGHHIYRDQPDLLVDAVVELVTLVREEQAPLGSR